MLADPQYIARLILRKQQEGISEQEDALLNQVLNAPGIYPGFSGEVQNEDTLLQWLLEEQKHREIHTKERIFERIRTSVVFTRHDTRHRPASPMSRMFPGYRWLVAASVLVLIAAGMYMLIKDSHSAKNPSHDIAQYTIHPGREGALLTLADGAVVSLDSVKNKTIALQGGAVAKVVDGILVYENTGSEVLYNTMSTPKGRQFNLTLPDGTRVWLNSASSIRFPTLFSGNERRVNITGEAYFQVAENGNMPFKISVNNKAEIRVLGTQFNINAYENETAITTTLISGSVQVQTPANIVLLKPGQQAQIHHGNNVNASGISVVNNADIDKAIAWRQGIFNFEDMPFDEVMRQLERWYDIDVMYSNGVPHIELFGKMNKDISLNDLLVVLERLGVHYKLDGRKLIVSD